MGLTEHADTQQKNEINFWNGKVANMRRDLDYQQQFAGKMMEDNKKVKREQEGLVQQLKASERNADLLQKQI